MNDLKMIESSCSCFEDNLKMVKEKVKEQLPEHEDLKADWAGKVYVLGNGESEYAPVNPKVEFSYQGFKKSGDKKASRNKDTVSLTSSYCCFCGRKYKRAQK